MSDRRIVRDSLRRNTTDKLLDVLSQKRTQEYLRKKGLTVQSIRSQPLTARHQPKTPQSAPHRPIVQHPYTGDSILLTGGIGDVLALESYFSDQQRSRLANIYYATRARKGIQEILSATPIFARRNISHISLWDDFSDFFAFHSKEEVYRKLRQSSKQLPQRWNHIADWSIATIFPLVNNGTIRHDKLSVLQDPVADINRFSLPQDYCVICPYSINDKRLSDRDFNSSDWAVVVDRLEQIGLKGVVLNVGGDVVPKHQTLKDFSNQTTLPEAIEILKKAKGYFGIDSSLSVVATRLFDWPNLVVKSQNGHLFACKHIYYPTKNDYSFIRSRMEF